MDIKSLPIEAKVGQLMMFGFKGPEVSEHIKKYVQQYNLGGIIHFSRNILNPQQIAQVNQELQDLAKASPWHTGLFISTDQEGGSVARLTTGAAVAPGNMALGATCSAHTVERVCDVMGKELAAVGINMNLAPVVDVNNNPANPVIGVRSFGEDPQAVAELGVAAIRGYQQHVMAVAKHFPGHGDTDLDSHLSLPVISHERACLESVELIPFKRAIAQGVAGIMTAHVFFPAIEPTVGRPATLSYAVLTELLRMQLGFDGLVLTDCMEMKAIADNFGLAEAAVMTIEAGADLVLVSHLPELQEQAFAGLLQAVRQGRISEERIDQSLQRIAKAKAAYGLTIPPTIDLDRVEQLVGCNQHLAVMEQAAADSITLVRGGGQLPISSDQVLVVECSATAANIAEDVLVEEGTLASALQELGCDVRQVLVDVQVTEAQAVKALQLAHDAARIVFVSQDAHRNSTQAQLINQLVKQQPNLVVVGNRTPYELASFPEVPTYIAAYGSRPLVWKAVAKLLLGKLTTKGKLPVSIPGLYGVGHKC